jgi:DNA polymerase II small subunit/DNA polymerase delta subunit B
MGKSPNDSLLMKLRVLEKEYKLTMLEYRQIYNDYLTELKSIQGTGSSSIQLILQGYVMSSDSSSNILETIESVESASSCQSECSSNSGCYGATYKSTPATCTIYGKGNLIPIKSTNDNYAILTDISQLVLKLKYLNTKLTKELKEINDILTQLKKTNKLEEKDTDDSTVQLMIEYKRLEKEKHQILELEKINDSLTNEYDTTKIMVTQTNTAYILWVILAIGVIIFIVKVFYK